MGRKLKNSDRGTAKFIRIRNEKMWEVIDRLSALDKYKSNFNKLVNDALMYGLPKLYAAEFGISEQEETPKPEQSGGDIVGDSFLKIVRLLREVIINENINKSIVCSLFQVKELELEGTAEGKQFGKGYFQEAPDFLSDYEIRELRKLRD
ncbi:MAG: hypothetical protein LBQ40_02475 [Clostridiales bacterium]|nr:hypothetical protein [Clostridiales bacterium]